LEFTLASKHLIVVAETILQLVFVLVLKSLLLKLDVSESAFLLLLLLSFVLLESLLVSQGLAIDKSLISNELSSQFGLLVSHLRSEINLLSRVLLLKFLPHRCLFGLVSVLDLEVNVTQNVLLAETQLLERVVVGLLWHRVLKLL